MESSSWPENLPSNRIKAIQELTQGQVLINKLREMLEQPEKIESGLKSADDTVTQLLGMFENTISILSSSSSSFNQIYHKRIHETSSLKSWDDQKSEDSIESANTVIPVKTRRGCYKRRKTSSVITKLTSNLIDDGYAWRKYGQKVILNSKHQRNYYRCTHKYEQGCQATKQVQKTDEEPSKYMITYHGHHTCNNLQKSHEISLDSPNPRDNSVILSFETNTLTERKQVGSFTSSAKHQSNDGFRSLSIKNDKVSSSDCYTTWDPVSKSSQVPLEPKSMMLSVLDHEDMVSSGVFSSACSTHRDEINNMLGSNDHFGDFLSELCS